MSCVHAPQTQQCSWCGYRRDEDAGDTDSVITGRNGIPLTIENLEDLQENYRQEYERGEISRTVYQGLKRFNDDLIDKIEHSNEEKYGRAGVLPHPESPDRSSGTV